MLLFGIADQKDLQQIQVEWTCTLYYKIYHIIECEMCYKYMNRLLVADLVVIGSD